MRQREAEADELRQSVPSKRRYALLNSGVLTAIMVSALTAIKLVFFGS